MKKTFPNGFTSWQETHFEVAAAIAAKLSEDVPAGRVAEVQENHGHGGLYELAEELTDKFEESTQGREWDGEFFDEIEEFLENELK